MITKRNLNTLLTLGLVSTFTSSRNAGGGSINVKDGKQPKPKKVVPNGCSVFIIEGQEIPKILL